MAGFDPDVFGAPASPAAQGFDSDVFTTATPAKPKTLAMKQLEPMTAPRGYFADRLGELGNVLAGGVRGAGSIGATLIAPYDIAKDALAGKGLSLESNRQRRADIDGGLQSAFGADPTSGAYQGGQLLGEIAGTAGAGGAVANTLGRIPGAATALPNLIPAIRTGGMTAGGATGAYGMGARIAGGAVNGAVTAGAVDPANAEAGMAIGGAFPVVTKALGAAGGKIGGMMADAPVNPVKMQTARDAIEAGYVIPPNMLKPSLGRQVIESISGKQATQQVASTRNTAVTDGLVRQALGIAPDVPMSSGTLEGLRKTAGAAYADVSKLSPQASADLEALKVARNEAQGWFKAYNRSARPDDLVQAKAARALSDSLEAQLESHALAANQPELIPALRDARKQIAKTYTVGRALNDASGELDARVFGRMSEKGLPLSDGLDVAGKFASAFPSVAKSPQQIGSPAAHNLKAIASGAFGLAGNATLGPMGIATAALPFLAPPLARAQMFSGRVQRGLLSQPGARGLLGMSLDEALPLMYRINPLLAGGVNGP